jgi:hypothetical protein
MTDDRGQRTELRIWDFEVFDRFYDFYDFYAFNDLNGLNDLPNRLFDKLTPCG